jgi:hypothetical protein
LISPRALQPTLIAILVLAAATSFTAGAGATGVLNPCSLVPASKVASSVGLSGVVLTGTRSTRSDGAVKQTVCTFKHGDAQLEIYVSPHQASGLSR